MKLKNIWLIFGILFLILVPVKICSAISPIDFVESPTFLIIFGLVAATLALFALFGDYSIKNISLKQSNIILGVLAAITSGCFFWCIPAYFSDTITKYDAEWHPIILTVFSALVCVTFLLIAITHFKGKNFIAKAPFFIYCPLLWLGARMILFLSMNINETNPYVVFSTGLLTFFMLYYTQTFATSTKANNVKILFIFGLPFVLFGFCSTVPVIWNALTSPNFVMSKLATASTEFALTLYILFSLFTAYKQSISKQKDIIKAIPQ